MTQQHTPGPWAINGGRIEVGFPFSSCSHVVGVIGTVNAQTLEDTANARLIAAAPDLLRVCKLMLARLDLEAETETVFLGAAMRDSLRAAIERTEKGE